MNSILKYRHGKLLYIILILISLSWINVNSQDITDTEELSTTVHQALLNEFINAINSDDRGPMSKFVHEYYDKNILKRIPEFAIVSLNRSYFYEAGGKGYQIERILQSNKNQLSFVLLNNLTRAELEFNIPLSEGPLTKIVGFIKAKMVDSRIVDSSFKKFNEEEVFKKLSICLNKLEADDEFSGAILIAKEGKVIVKKAIGEANKSYNISNYADTKFNIASVGKVFTGVAITQLVERGKLSFEDSISNYISDEWLPKEISKKIKVKHLLTHTSGMGDYFRDAYQQCETPVFRNLDDYKTLLNKSSLLFEPGTRFNYSNSGMLLLGVIIEKVSGMEYFEFLQNSIFGPAGMKNTGGFDKDVPIQNRATGYTKIHTNNEISWNNHQFTRIMRGSPSGGIYSTVEDIYKFNTSLMNNELLSSDFTKLIFEGRPELNSSFHSYGFFVSEGAINRIASHKGDGRGMNCQYKIYMDKGYTVIVLFNYSQPSANIVTNVFDQLVSIE